MAKKPKMATMQLRVPIPVAAFYEGVAAYAGVNVGQAMAVVLAIRMLSDRSDQRCTGQTTG